MADTPESSWKQSLCLKPSSPPACSRWAGCCKHRPLQGLRAALGLSFLVLFRKPGFLHVAALPCPTPGSLGGMPWLSAGRWEDRTSQQRTFPQLEISPRSSLHSRKPGEHRLAGCPPGESPGPGEPTADYVTPRARSVLPPRERPFWCAPGQPHHPTPQAHQSSATLNGWS